MTWGYNDGVPDGQMVFDMYAQAAIILQIESDLGCKNVKELAALPGGTSHPSTGGKGRSGEVWRETRILPRGCAKVYSDSTGTEDRSEPAKRRAADVQSTV